MPHHDKVDQAEAWQERFTRLSAQFMDCAARARRLEEALRKHDCPVCHFEIGDGGEWVCRACRDLRAALKPPSLEEKR